MPGNLRCFAILFGICILPGCGPSGPVMVPVSGNVTLDGKPLDDGTIFFITVQEGSIDQMVIKQGKFEGLVEVGDRRVEVCRFRDGKTTKVGHDTFPSTINTVSPRYNTKSELTATVAEGGANEFNFAVTSK